MNKHEFMIGTEGKPDYLIIGKKKSYLIGLKVVMAPASAKVMAIALKIRVTWSDPDDRLDNKFLRAQMFPKCQFTAIDSTRASGALVRHYNIMNHLANQRLAWFDEVEALFSNKNELVSFVDQAMSLLSLGEAQMAHSNKEIADYVASRLGRALLAAKIKSSSVNTSLIEKQITEKITMTNLSSGGDEPA
jgi:hypothetical protein